MKTQRRSGVRSQESGVRIYSLLTTYSLLLVLLLGGEAFAASWGFDFRSSQVFVVDPANTTYVIDQGGGFGSTYPTTRGGITFGWTSQPLLNLRDRDAAVDPRLAGSQFANSTATFRVDLPSPGIYTIDLALGDALFPMQVQSRIFDNTTVLATIGPMSVTGGQFVDATGTVRASAAAWVSGHQTRDLTFATSTFFITLDSAQAAIAHLNISSGAPDTIAPTVPTNVLPTVISADQINLTWGGSTDTPPGTVLYYSAENCSGAGCVNFAEFDTSPTTSLSDTLLQPNTVYRYRIRAFDGTNFSAYSTVVQATTLANRQATVTWADLINTDHTGFTLQRKTGVAGTYADIVTVGPALRTYVDANSPQPIACYRVRAVRSGEDGPQSSEVCTTTSAPTAPINLVIGGRIAFGGANTTAISGGLIPFYTALRADTIPGSCPDMTGASPVNFSAGYNSTPDIAPQVRFAWGPGTPVKGYICIQANDATVVNSILGNDDDGMFDAQDYAEWRLTPTTTAQIAESVVYAASANAFTWDATYPAGVENKSFNSNMACTPSGSWQVFCTFDLPFAVADNQFGRFQMLMGDMDASYTYRIMGGTDSQGVNVPANWRIIKYSSSPLPVVPGGGFTVPFYYVSITGSGTVCSLAAPCALSRIAAAAKPGDTWILKNGTYSAAGSVIFLDGNAGVSNGTVSQQIRVTSENAASCVSAATCAVLQGNGASGHVLRVQNLSYWNFDNLIVRNADNSANTGSNASILGTFNASNLTFKKMVFADNNTYGNNDAVLLQGSNILIEDSDILRSHRNYIACTPGGTSNVTIRRVYMSQPISFHGTNFGPGDGSVFYSCHDSINENTIVEGLVGYGFTGWGDTNSITGGISIANNGGFFNGTSSSIPNENGRFFTGKDLISINDQADTCIYLRPTEATITGASCFNNHIIVNDEVVWNVPIFNATIRNALVNGTQGGSSGILLQDINGSFATKSLSFSRAFNTGGINGGWTQTSNTTSDPTMGSCRVWVPLTSNLKGAGLSGADIGANVIFATVNGTLTSQKLWNSTTGQTLFGPPIVAGVNSSSTGLVRSTVGSRLNITAAGCLPAGY